jgi:hypothetical protein
MNNKRNGSFKPKKVYFTQVSNHALRDKNLSLKAKGLFALIQSFVTLPDFILYKNTLKKNCEEGQKAFESTWKELKDKGYLAQEKHQNPDGTFYYVYELLDVPIQTPKKEGMDKGGYGKGGVYNNTYSNNTDLNNTSYNNDNNGAFINAQKCFLFFELYERTFNIRHPFIKKEQLEKAESIITDFMNENLMDMEQLEILIIGYFNTNFPDGIDYNLNHFATSGIMQNRYYEYLYGR